MSALARGRGFVRPGLALALLGSCTALFFLTCERRELPLRVGFQGEARENRYLAAERMLSRMGMQLRAIDGMDQLLQEPPLDGTLIFPTPRATLSRERSAKLRQWVEQGGHLLVVSWTDWDDPERRADFLLDELGVRQRVYKFDAEPREQEEPKPDFDALAEIHFQDRATPLRAAFDPLYRLERPDAPVFRSVADANGIHLMELVLGKGLLTVLTDDYVLANASIADHDHAELLWRMVHAREHTGPVWIVFSESHPGPWGLVWQHGAMILASLGLLVAAWSWAASRRFGPLLAEPDPGRRRLMEHIEAAGRFQWREGAAQQLLHSVRASLLERVGQRHPGWLALGPAELEQRLADLSRLPRESIARALAFRAREDRDAFARNIATLEKIRKAL